MRIHIISAPSSGGGGGGGAPVPLSGAGAPVSGAAGVAKGTLYLDTSLTPNVVYINVGTLAVSSWMSLLSGNVV